MFRLTLAAALLVLGCQPADTLPAVAEFTQADRDAIEAQRDAWEAAANAGNWDSVAALYTEDATALPPNSPMVTGRAGVRQAFAAMPPVGDVKLTTGEVVATAEMAVVRGNYSLNLMLPGANAAIADTGKFVELWRKQSDGRWLLSWDIWNSDIPLPAPPAK